MAKKGTNKKVQKNDGTENANFFGSLLSRVGKTGFILVVGTTFIFTFASSDQKQEIIDVWVLFKGENSANHLKLALFMETVILVAVLWAYHKQKKLLQNRIDEITEQKSFFQNVALGTDLNTSK